jgi:hypothetical protein
MPSVKHLAALLAAASLGAVTIAAPSFAAAPSTVHHTSLNARATKDAVKPAHTDVVVLTLRSGKKALAGESDNFQVRMRRGVSTSHAWSEWTAVAAEPGVKDGRYRITVTMPESIHKGRKEQYQVRFTGDTTNGYHASRSQVFTVRAR